LKPGATVQLSTWLGHVIKSGKATIFTGDSEALQIKAENNRIELRTDNKKFLKEIVDSAGNTRDILSKLSQLKSMAGELKDEGLTYTLFYKGTQVLTIGSDAKPKLLRMITRTNAIEINSMSKLLEISF